MRVEQALEWTRGKGISDILDLSMALESYSYDLYLKMERTLTDGHARRVFLVLAEEEAKHLESMAALIEKRRLRTHCRLSCILVSVCSVFF